MAERLGFQPRCRVKFGRVLCGIEREVSLKWGLVENAEYHLC